MRMVSSVRQIKLSLLRSCYFVDLIVNDNVCLLFGYPPKIAITMIVNVLVGLLLSAKSNYCSVAFI